MSSARASRLRGSDVAREERPDGGLGAVARRRAAPHDVGAPPAAAPLAVHAMRLATTKRVALVRSGAEESDLCSVLRGLATAARARIEWSDRAGGVGPVLTRALSESDAVITDRVPCLRGGDRALLPRFHSVVRAPSAFGSSVSPCSLRRADLLLVGAVTAGASAWERSVRFATEWTRAEGRRSIHCAVRDPGWPILASDRARRFRRLVAERPDLEARRIGYQDVRRRLLLEPQGFEAIVADAGDVDALSRAACAGVGWSNRVPSIFVGEDRTLVVLGDAAGSVRCVESGETAFAIARATQRLLRHLGEIGAAERIGAALAAELAARLESTGDLWLDLASETPASFAAALATRIADGAPSAAN